MIYAGISCILVVMAMCMYHAKLQDAVVSGTNGDRELLRHAAELSIMASNTVDPVTALEHSSRAVEVLESIRIRYGHVLPPSIVHHDFDLAFSVITKQRDRIKLDLSEYVNAHVPQSTHPLQSIIVSGTKTNVDEADAVAS